MSRVKELRYKAQTVLRSTTDMVIDALEETLAVNALIARGDADAALSRNADIARTLLTCVLIQREVTEGRVAESEKMMMDSRAETHQRRALPNGANGKGGVK